MNMEYIHVVLDVYHDITLRCFQDVEIVKTTHGVHPPPIGSSPLVDPPLEPYESYASIETNSPTHSVALSLHPYLLSHLLDPFVDVMGNPLAITDLCHVIKQLLILDTIQKYFHFLVFLYQN
jgi:hypothetical protein